MPIQAPEDYENHILEDIESQIKEYSEMAYSERQFINGIIRQLKPKKIIEVGVAAGASSAVILNAIKDIENAKLHSLDYSQDHYRREGKKTGFVVDEFPQLKEKWELYTGGIACSFLDEIGSEVDLCLLDTTHHNPGEFLDYLQILPYMKKNGVIIIHDTSLHILKGSNDPTTCCTLLSAISGEKIIPSRSEHKFFPNIGAVILDDNAKKKAFDIFNCLCLPWFYMPKENDILQLETFFSKHYNSKLVNNFLLAVEYNKSLFKKKKKILPQKMDFINYFKEQNAQKQINKLAKQYKDKRIAIYGAGQYCKTVFENYDFSKLNIVAVVDRAFEDESKRNFFNLNCITPKDLKELDCDIILLGVSDINLISNYLKKELLVNCKNSKIKIGRLIKQSSWKLIKKLVKELIK